MEMLCVNQMFFLSVCKHLNVHVLLLCCERQLSYLSKQGFLWGRRLRSCLPTPCMRLLSSHAAVSAATK